MKRLRDEVYMNPQFKRPFGSSRGESYGLLHAPGGGDGAGGSGGGVAGAGGSSGGVAGAGGSGGGGATGGTQKLTTNDALTYLKEVKDMFQDQREKYDRFLDVMKDFKAQRVDTTGVIMRVKELFKGHPNLILGFNTFLPRGYEITLTEVEGAPKRTVEFEEAIDFVNKIKSRFQDDDRVYKDFLAILNMYRNEHKGIADVYDEVSVLFSEHPDLLRQFTRFLPDTSTTASTALASFGRHSLHRFDERSSAMPTMRHSHVDKQRLRRDKIIITRGERDLSVERLEVDDDKTVMTSHKDRKKRAERDNKDKRNRYQDNRDTDNENNGDISMHRLSDKKKSAQKVDNFGGNSNFVSYDDKDALKSMYSQEFAFCEKVKERLGSADDYQSFLKFLHLYSTEIITKKQLHGLIADLLRKHPDLMEGFKEFFERCERIEGFLAGVMGKKTLWSEGHSSKALRIEDKDREQKREVDGGKEKDRFSSKYLGKSIQELDLSNCQSCTPSYRLLPEDYPIAAASQRSELGAQVLNDHWVSVTSGSEDYSFKHMRRNQYEESLFRCEDDRFELDMLLESVSSAAKRAEELLNSINDNSDNPICIEEHFTALNLRCIERLYGDHGLDVMDILHKNPSLALPVILSRLKQKQEEWTKCRADFNKVWAEIYAKNHYKSLDHRSFYFKQQDSKNLGTKSLVAEIKEIKEKNENEDHVLLGIAAGNNFTVRPNLEFEYADADIHEDLYEIIKYSSEEICTTKEQSNKVLRFYTTFLEPMLGVQSWRRKSEATEVDGSSKLGTAKNMVTSITESDGSPNADATTMNLKQPKPTCNGDSNSSPTRVNSCKTGFTNIDTLAKADGSTVASGGQLPNSGSAVTIGPDANHGLAANSSRANNDLGEDSHGSKLNMEDTLCSEGGETSRLNLANGGYVDGSRLAGHDEVFVDAGKVDNGADKISPRGEFEDNIATHQDGGSQSMAEKKRGHGERHFKTRGHEEISPDAADENDADADDEDSENASEAGEDESAADGSGEEHEEEEDGEIDGEGEAEDTSDGTFLPHAERFLLTCKPLSKHVASPLQGTEGNNHQVFYGNDTFYVLFRLHETLYERVLSAKVNSASAESKLKTTTKDASSDPYTRFKSALFGLLDGSSDNSKFEEDCRSLIGNQSYVLFTLDKLIYKLVKQLQIVSSDEVGYKLLQLYEYEKSRKLHDVDLVYYENVHFILHDENIYRIECTSSPTQLSIQLMDDGNEKSEVVPVSVDPDFADYFYNDYLSATNGRKESSAVVLKRNMRKYANVDESSALHLAMENVLTMNGLECKTSATTSKISYVLDTEDSFIRLGKIRDKSGGKSSLNNQARVQHFHQYLMASVMP